jgi:hypothetical protein
MADSPDQKGESNNSGFASELRAEGNVANIPVADLTGLRPTLTELTGPKEWLKTNSVWLSVVVVGLIFVLIIASLFLPFVIRVFDTRQTTLLEELSSIGVARGLITFLIAVSTVGIALIVTVFAVSTSDTRAEKNVAMAKEILSPLIGVLGAIVGFYFGSTANLSSQQLSTAPTQVIEMRIAQATLEPAFANPGEKFKITAQISGGKPPYDYSISFTAATISTLNKQNGDGKIGEEFTVPQGLPPGTTIEAAITARDQIGTSVHSGEPLKLAVR